MTTKIRLGTRPSKLALAQSQLLADRFKALFPEMEIEIIPIRTAGDEKQNKGENIARDKKDWVQEIEQAILENNIDLALHSAKDVPYDLSSMTRLHSVLERADPRDVFIGRKKGEGDQRVSLNQISSSGLVGTSSLRRQMQLKLLYPQLQSCNIRGNVPTRIARLDSSPEISGIILAAAGLSRLNIDPQTFEPIACDSMLPASAQGILAVQYLKSRSDIAELSSSLIHRNTEAALTAERAAIEQLGADCHSAVAVYATTDSQNLKICARVFSCTDGRHIESHYQTSVSAARECGMAVADSLLNLGAAELLKDKN